MRFKEWWSDNCWKLSYQFSAAKAAYQAGMADERGRIVADLRKQAFEALWEGRINIVNGLADRIEGE